MSAELRELDSGKKNYVIRVVSRKETYEEFYRLYYEYKSRYPNMFRTLEDFMRFLLRLAQKARIKFT